ncbi:hypothetical protein M096_3158 [Parabacteroides distasonis str. 3999B T(B) 6]|nr:hypothetical protein M096_3158 [Parabacteroides distasonis str. 3999B T(B) 6]
MDSGSKRAASNASLFILSIRFKELSYRDKYTIYFGKIEVILTWHL